MIDEFKPACGSECARLPLFPGHEARATEVVQMPHDGIEMATHILPQVPYPDLPQYLKAADVLIIPYNITEYTESIFPIKFFEFMATGKPVVASALPSLEPYAPIVPLSSTYQGFLKALDDVLRSEDTTQSQRIELAKTNTWQSRLEELSTLIEKSLSAS